MRKFSMVLEVHGPRKEKYSKVLRVPGLGAVRKGVTSGRQRVPGVPTCRGPSGQAAGLRPGRSAGRRHRTPHLVIPKTALTKLNPRGTTDPGAQPGPAQRAASQRRQSCRDWILDSWSPVRRCGYPCVIMRWTGPGCAWLWPESLGPAAKARASRDTGRQPDDATAHRVGPVFSRYLGSDADCRGLWQLPARRMQDCLRRPRRCGGLSLG